MAATKPFKGLIRRRSLALLLLSNLIMLTASQSTDTPEPSSSESSNTGSSTEESSSPSPSTESPTGPGGPNPSPGGPNPSPGGPNPPPGVPGVPPPPTGIQVKCNWTTECKDMGPGYCSMNEVKEEFFNRTYQEGNETKVIPPGEDIPDGVGQHQIHCEPIADKFLTMTESCICVGDLVPGAYSSRVRSHQNQNAGSKPKPNKSKSRHGRQVGFCQQTKTTPCVTRYLSDMVSKRLTPIEEFANTEPAEEGARCDPEKEALLSAILVDMQMYQEYLYRTLEMVDRLFVEPPPGEPRPDEFICNRRRLMSCNATTSTCGCTDGGPLPPHQSTPTGHRFITSRGVRSYYCYATGGTCNLDPVEVMPQFPDVARKLKAHYGDPLVPSHLDDMGCLKNLCAWVKEGEKVCSPQETGPGSRGGGGDYPET